MTDTNHVVITGNLTADPEETQVKDQPMARFRIACNDNPQNKDSVSYLPIVAFGKQADYVASALHKGDKVVVIGRLRSSGRKDEEGQSRRSDHRDERGVRDVQCQVEVTGVGVGRGETFPCLPFCCQAHYPGELIEKADSYSS